MGARRRGPQAIAGVVAAFLTAAIAVPLNAAPIPVRAHAVIGPVQVGTSFSPRRAEAFGLDYQAAFKTLLDLHFRVIRIPVYWDETDATGPGRTDWLMEQAKAAGQPVVLSVGMKSLGWPEYYIPGPLQPTGDHFGARISDNAELRAAALGFVEQTITRYRGSPVLVAWQIENEPLNRAGPQRWWIGDDFLAQEMAVARGLDSRPLIVNTFTHFNMGLDRASSSRFDLRSLLGFDGATPEKRSLAVLGRGDILGLDVYTRIAYRQGDQVRVSQADSDWDDSVARWHATAESQGKRTWVTEAQAEPWEADWGSMDNPRSFGPEDMTATFGALKQAGVSTVLLWGSEYWLHRAGQGDGRWLEAVRSLLAAEAKAPPLA